MRRAVFHPLAQLEVVDEVIPVEARGVRKSFGHTVALDGIDLTIGEGRILGLVGPNGAGKTTFLHAMLGLTPYEGTLRVLGHDPRTERHRLMRDATFIADVSIVHS
jgi:ABC-2 type transport system ATP-binding protein